MHSPPPRRPLSVQVFLVSLQPTRQSCLLLQRHPVPELELPDFWQGVTGALEADESFEQAAMREVFEECRIRISCVVDTGFVQRFPIRASWRQSYGAGPTEVEERIFYALIRSRTPPPPRLSAEHQSWRWCSFEEANALLTFGQNRQCFRAVQDHLSSRHDT